MNIADYIRAKDREINEQNEAPKSPEEAPNKYSSYSEEQLMSELFRLGSLSSGKISAEELDSFFANVQGYLSPEQLARMKDLITQLKNS